MKIKIAKGLSVDSGTLIRLEWRKFYPVLVLHEKFENILKWILRGFAFVGIATSVITINEWYISLTVAIVIFLIEQFFERTALEYTSIIMQPPPNFEVDYNQWKTNGFMIPLNSDGNELAYFGPSYSNEEYALKFFSYLRSWVTDDSNDDTENDLVISIILEPNEEYTTYLYANPDRKRLTNMFKSLREQSKFEKYGKHQQQLVFQIWYWKTLDYKKGYYIEQFLEFQKEGKPFIFTPSVIQPFNLPPKFLYEEAIKKYNLKVKRRIDLTNADTEYKLRPDKIEQREKKIYQPDEAQEMTDVLSNSEDVGFISNEGKKAGVISLCFSEPELAVEAYKILVKMKGDQDIVLRINEIGERINIAIEIVSRQKVLLLKNLAFNKSELDLFKEKKGGGDKVVMLIGYPPANSRKIILPEGVPPLVVSWKLNES